MLQSVKMLTQCLLILCTSIIIMSFSGCSYNCQEPLPPVIMKPKIPEVPEAKVVQCKKESIFENSQCVLLNYIEVKKERDTLRQILENIK